MSPQKNKGDNFPEAQLGRKKLLRYLRVPSTSETLVLSSERAKPIVLSQNFPIQILQQCLSDNHQGSCPRNMESLRAFQIGAGRPKTQHTRPRSKVFDLVSLTFLGGAQGPKVESKTSTRRIEEQNAVFKPQYEASALSCGGLQTFFLKICPQFLALRC